MSQKHEASAPSLLLNINLKLIRKSARPIYKKASVGLCLFELNRVFFQTKMNLALSRVMQTYVQRNPPTGKLKRIKLKLRESFD